MTLFLWCVSNRTISESCCMYEFHFLNTFFAPLPSFHKNSQRLVIRDGNDWTLLSTFLELLRNTTDDQQTALGLTPSRGSSSSVLDSATTPLAQPRLYAINENADSDSNSNNNNNNINNNNNNNNSNSNQPQQPINPAVRAITGQKVRPAVAQKPSLKKIQTDDTSSSTTTTTTTTTLTAQAGGSGTDTATASRSSSTTSIATVTALGDIAAATEPLPSSSLRKQSSVLALATSTPLNTNARSATSIDAIVATPITPYTPLDKPFKEIRRICIITVQQVNMAGEVLPDTIRTTVRERHEVYSAVEDECTSSPASPTTTTTTTTTTRTASSSSSPTTTTATDGAESALPASRTDSRTNNTNTTTKAKTAPGYKLQLEEVFVRRSPAAAQRITDNLIAKTVKQPSASRRGTAVLDGQDYTSHLIGWMLEDKEQNVFDWNQ